MGIKVVPTQFVFQKITTKNNYYKTRKEKKRKTKKHNKSDITDISDISERRGGFFLESLFLSIDDDQTHQHLLYSLADLR